MTTFYRVAIQDNANLTYCRVRNPRSSAGKRHYTACVVATATVQTVELMAQKLMEAETALVRSTQELVSLTNRLGMSCAEAQQAHEAAQRAWWDLLHGYENKVREGRQGMSRVLSDTDRKKAKDMAAADGHLDPYLPGQAYDIVETNRFVENARHSIDFHTKRNIKVGDQMVVSWHKDVQAAQKGLVDAQDLKKNGFTLEIRTDIEVTTK